MLRPDFRQVRPYLGSVPLYGAPWTRILAGERFDPLASSVERAARLDPGCRYDDREIHRAAFALPSEVRRKLAKLD